VLALRGYQLDVVVVLPPSSHLLRAGADAQLARQLGGLLGNANGLADDDLTSRSGLTLSSNASDQIIYNQFGETCQSQPQLPHGHCLY